jgi:hypothetical protein
MKLIQNNPYRIAGILSNATERELQKQKTRIKAYSRVGKEIKSDFDFNILGGVTRTEDSIGKAFSSIEQNKDKVNYSLFWFLNANPFDNTALEYLKNGDEEKAVEIWEKVTLNKEVDSKFFSAFNNLGTYKLLSNSEIEIKQGVDAKIKLIESDYFENFVHSVADETFTIDNKKQVQELVDELLIQFKNQYSSSEILQLFSNCNGTTQKHLSQKFTEEPIHNIESEIESAKSKRKDNNSEAYEFGVKLYTNCKEDLSLLKSLLGVSDLKYKIVADQLANEIMQCGIDYFKEWQDTNDPSEKGLELLKYAKSISVGSQTKDRVDSNLEGLQEWAETYDKRKEIKRLNDYCWYCDRNVGVKGYVYGNNMYKETERNGWLEKKKYVNYEKCTVHINRCEECYRIHGKSEVSLKVILPLYIVCLLYYIFEIFSTDEMFWSIVMMIFLPLIPVGIVIWVVSSILDIINAQKYNIKKESNINSHPETKELIKNGWTHSEPPA